MFLQPFFVLYLAAGRGSSYPVCPVDLADDKGD